MQTEQQPVDPLVDDDYSDVITSAHIETAVNLATRTESSDVELSPDIVEFLRDQGEVRERLTLLGPMCELKYAYKLESDS